MTAKERGGVVDRGLEAAEPREDPCAVAAPQEERALIPAQAARESSEHHPGQLEIALMRGEPA